MIKSEKIFDKLLTADDNIITCFGQAVSLK